MTIYRSVISAFCDFCGRDESRVGHLIMGRFVDDTDKQTAICGACARKAARDIADREAKSEPDVQHAMQAYAQSEIARRKARMSVK